MIRRFGGWGAVILAVALTGCGGDAGTGDDDDDTIDETGDGDDDGVPEDLDAITTTDRPQKRSEIKAVGNTATNSILMFGGNSGPVVNQIIASDFQNDTWIFQPGTGWIEVDSEVNPRKRGRYAIAVDEEGHRALLFGGRYRAPDTTGDYLLFNDVWEFDFDERQWTKLHDGTGVAPAPRYYPEAAYDPSSGIFYVFGGAINENPLIIDVAMDLWAWDGTSWTELQTTGQAPTTRTFLASTYDPVRNWFVIFGGQAGDFVSCATNDLFALDLNTLEWQELHPGGINARTPETRFHAHLEYDPVGDRYLMFGGHADIGAMNDLWAFDPEAREWSEVHIADILERDPNAACDNVVKPGCGGIPTEVPKDFAIEDPDAPERRYRGMFVYMHDSLWLGAGINIECSDHIDDTWRYDIASDTWHELVEARAGESCIRRGDDCACMCI